MISQFLISMYKVILHRFDMCRSSVGFRHVEPVSNFSVHCYLYAASLVNWWIEG
jgi:hypothetical protein